MTIKALEDRIGSLSKPSKMPCHGYSLPAHTCKRGSLLRQIPGSVCADCYALKNRYLFDNVQTALYKRFDAVTSNVTGWQELITQLINRKEHSGYFRWHDSGDIQSVEHLNALNAIALSLPHINFWLPTREYDLVKQWDSTGPQEADNLTIRLSANMVGQRAPSPTLKGTKKLNTSTVGLERSAFNCPASTQGNHCGKCRACWDSNVPNVNYKLH